jgi:hypothetical protein
MELILNLSWAFVAMGMLCAWACIAPSTASNRRVQLIALAVVILILLPEISMTDDLIAAQSPAEIVTCVRRDHDLCGLRSIAPAATALPLPLFAGLPIAVVHMGKPINLFEPFVDHPALAAIQNRPPPAA